MALRDSNVLFDDLFTIKAIDKEGKKFDRVSRLWAHSSNYDMDLTLDYNIELYPLHVDESFTLMLASSLQRGGPGAVDDEQAKNVWRPDGKGIGGLDDDFEYVMYGKVYKFDDGSSEKVTVYASFGGLLMALTGSYRHLQNITIGEALYLLMRR